VRAITISRTKAVIQLPRRVDEIHHLNFTPAERETYEDAKIQSRTLLEEAISSGNQGGKTFNALRLLNILRLICNHGLLAQSTTENTTSRAQTSQGGRSPDEASDSFYGNILGGATCCLNCGANLLEDILEGSVLSDLETRHQTTSYEQMICELCISQTSDDRIGQLPRDTLDLPDSGTNSARATPSTPERSATPATPMIDYDTEFTIESMSTKIKALVADLSKHSTTEKRSGSKPPIILIIQPANMSPVSYFPTGPTHLILSN
jgi:SWI/SNF-related matrix-associated actin-dependent regulator of chromatin subfamily A3